MSPVQALLKSRKFLVLALDTVISLVLYFVTKYTAPSAVEDVKTVIVALQPVALVLIGAIAYEDGKSMQAEALVEAARIQQEPASAQ